MKTETRGEVFILTPAPIEQLGGMERFLDYLATGFRERGFAVRVFHRENCAPSQWRQTNPKNKLKWFIAGTLQGYFIGRAARKALHPGVRLVISNSTVGWYPLGHGIRTAHYHHGTYRGQAEAIRPLIHYRGYLKLKWWDAMVLERASSKNKIVLCCSDPIREELRRFFGADAYVVWYPMDLTHFRPLDQKTCRQELGLSESAPSGAFVGSWHPMKGLSSIEYLIRTFPEVTWLLALRGEVPERLRAFANVRIFQNATYDLLPLIYNAADFSLCPSRYDPFALVVAEALACGTPVIASPVGASLVFHKGRALDPFLINSADDYQGFERAVRLVLSDPGKWREVVRREVRPHLEEIMSPENWWGRFQKVVGL